MIEFKNNVALIGAGPLNSDSLSEILALVPGVAPGVVAADGGADRAIELGQQPDWVIGDLDSLSDGARAALEGRLIEVSEQESTDFEKCLRLISAPLVLALGFLGGRVDHELACLNALMRAQPSRCILIGDHDICFHAPRDLTLDLPAGTRVSLFPLCPLQGRSEGLEWPIEGLTLSPMGRVGTSNRALGPVRLSFEGEGMIVILPRDCLSAAMQALSGAGA